MLYFTIDNLKNMWPPQSVPIVKRDTDQFYNYSATPNKSSRTS